jgi:hypothetical protein
MSLISRVACIATAVLIAVGSLGLAGSARAATTQLCQGRPRRRQAASTMPAGLSR